MAWNRWWTPQQDAQSQWENADPVEQNNILLNEGRNEGVGIGSINPQWTRYFDLLNRRGARVSNAGPGLGGYSASNADVHLSPWAQGGTPTSVGADVQATLRKRAELSKAGLRAALLSGGGQ